MKSEFWWTKPNPKTTGYTRISQLGYYNTKEWKALRKMKIASNPLCEICLRYERLQPAEVVDHIEPITEDNIEKFYQYDNLQSLCNKCHWEKTNNKQSKYSKLLEGKKLQKELEND